MPKKKATRRSSRKTARSHNTLADKIALQMNGAVASRGTYLDLVKHPNGLILVPTKDGIAEAKDFLDARPNGHGCLEDLLEDHLGNGWEFISPEEIGAMTEGLIISDDVQRDEEGKFLDASDIYWFADYQVVDEISELAQGKVVGLRKGA